MAWGIDDLLMANVGLGALGTGFGAYSQYQQAKQQRALYDQQRQLAALLSDPNAIVSGAQPLYQANLAALRTGIPNIMRETVNPGLGIRGIDPAGGYGQLEIERALAPYYQQAWQGAVGDYTGNLARASSTLTGAGGSVPPAYGGMGGLSNSLMALALFRGMQNPNNQTANPYANIPANYPYVQDWNDPSMARMFQRPQDIGTLTPSPVAGQSYET